jgi:hypothetical protein
MKIRAIADILVLAMHSLKTVEWDGMKSFHNLGQ